MNPVYFLCSFLYLQNDVISCAQQVELLESQLASRLEQLQATVQSKTAVPTAQVYVSLFHLEQACCVTEFMHEFIFILAFKC